jgi:sec-independent protein translocase protein TatA
MPNIGPTELILIALVLVLVFGASKLGDIGGALGKSVREFKKATNDGDAAKQAAAATTATTTTAPPAATTVPSATVSAPVPTPDMTPAALEYRPSDQTSSAKPS